MSPLALALEQIRFARTYTLQRLADVDEADWFRPAPGGVTHVAWQVGHLALAQYRLALVRTRGTQPGDGAILAPEFLTLFGPNSVPADVAAYPPAAEIRAAFDRVHEHALREVAQLPPDSLDQPPELPHDLAKTKIACLFWCASHEMLHAGQIGLLRRLFGKPPIW
jgi:hypothetical protein